MILDRNLKWRQEQLEKLRVAIQSHEGEILSALYKDLGKSQSEAYLSEVGFLYEELRFAKKNLASWMRVRSVPTPWVLFRAKSFVEYIPKGRILIISPWNYPVQLALSPLIGALAAGNTAVLKPSELAPKSSEILQKLIQEHFDPGVVRVEVGDATVSQRLLREPWGHIFFTGGTAIGKIVMAAASETLSPITLELGGKSPCILDESADLATSLKRIAWGKFLNAGQTCVAPDYLLVPENMKEKVVSGLADSLKEFFGENPASSPDYGRIVHDRHIARLVKMLSGTRVRVGGQYDATTRYLAPTILDEVQKDAPVMKEEIFGPLLPVLTYRNFDEVIDKVKEHPNPLALYLFTRNRDRERLIRENLPSGGMAVNDTLVHLTNPHLPFGGIGTSGLGNYHGRFGFEVFSHARAVLRKSFWPDPWIRYAPFKKRLELFKKIMRP